MAVFTSSYLVTEHPKHNIYNHCIHSINWAVNRLDLLETCIYIYKNLKKRYIIYVYECVALRGRALERKNRVFYYLNVRILM